MGWRCEVEGCGFAVLRSNAHRSQRKYIHRTTHRSVANSGVELAASYSASSASSTQRKKRPRSALRSTPPSASGAGSVLDVVCMVCGQDDREDALLVCDAGCTRGSHMHCCDPPLETIPKGDWLCTLCRAEKLKPNAVRRRSTVYFDSHLNSLFFKFVTDGAQKKIAVKVRGLAVEVAIRIVTLLAARCDDGASLSELQHYRAEYLKLDAAALEDAVKGLSQGDGQAGVAFSSSTFERCRAQNQVVAAPSSAPQGSRGSLSSSSSGGIGNSAESTQIDLAHDAVASSESQMRDLTERVGFVPSAVVTPESQMEDLRERVRCLQRRVAAGDREPRILREYADAQEELPRALCEALAGRVQHLSQCVSSGDHETKTLRALANAQEELAEWHSRVASDIVLAISLIMSSPT